MKIRIENVEIVWAGGTYDQYRETVMQFLLSTLDDKMVRDLMDEDKVGGSD